METQTFYSDNDSETMADALKAVGLAEVFRAWLGALGRDQAPIIVENHESHYTITLPPQSPIGPDEISRIERPFPVGRGKLLMSAKQIEKMGQGERMVTVPAFDYDQKRAESSEYFARLKKLVPADRKRFTQHPEEFEEIRQFTPDADLDLYTYVNHFRSATNYNDLLLQWAGKDLAAFRRNLELILAIFSQRPNAIAVASEQWGALVKSGGTDSKGEVTRLQNINPASGKGINAPKANNFAPGNIDGFWLTEALKFYGLFTIAAPRMVKSSDPKSKDRKTYALHPTHVELRMLRDVMSDFRRQFYPTTAVKLDILAALDFTSSLIAYQRDAIADGQGDSFLAMFGQAPTITEIAQGFDITSYKDMGSAYATMNLATINLPDWLAPVTSVPQADTLLDLLKEHRLVVRSAQSTKGDEGSEEIELLRRYRDFLSGHDVTRFFAFAAHYGDYFLGKRHRNQWAAQFTTSGMETLVTQEKKPLYAEILKTEGFIAIARAIRQATVLAQYHSARESQGGKFPFEVRYALGQELLRAAAYPEEFLKALNRFIQAFNAENARIDERVAKGSLPNLPRNRRASIKTEHVDDIVRLIDVYQDAELICTMLVAYGYARDPRTPGAPSNEPEPGADAIGAGGEGGASEGGQDGD